MACEERVSTFERHTWRLDGYGMGCLEHSEDSKMLHGTPDFENKGEWNFGDSY